jgi:hypothetical protein
MNVKVHRAVGGGDIFGTMAYVRETAQITIRGASVLETQRKWINDAELNMIGEIHVVTDARVVEHNATGVLTAEGGGKEYVWVIRDMNGPAPMLTID